MTREPVRTCVGCRQAQPKGALVRLLRSPSGAVVVDRSGRGPGRGAYVCARAACVARGLERGRLSHAFRKPCEVGVNLAEEVTGLWQR